MSSEPSHTSRAIHDAESRQWVEHLRLGHPAHEEALARLHDVLLRVAFHELSRRRKQLGPIAGPEFDDLARQTADDALMNVVRRLDEFRGVSRFETWAYKLVTFEISDKVARRAWRRQPPSSEGLAWDRLPDWLAPRPGDGLEQREQLEVLSGAIAELGDRQREVFVAIALNDVPIDVLALELGWNRNAVYKTPFDEMARIADLVSFEPDKVAITIDGEKLEPVPGQTVLAHGPDRNLSVDEIGGIELVEPATAATE